MIAIFEILRLDTLLIDKLFYRSSSKQFNTYKAETFILIKVASVTVSSELAEDETNLLSPLRPYYTHDISFWSEPRAFSEKEFFATVKCLSANLVKFAYLLDKYPSGANQQLESRCYRLIYSCNNYSLTRENCGELQLRLRSQLSSHYDQMQNVQFCLR